MGIGVGDAAERLGVGHHRVRTLIGTGHLAAERVSGVYIIDANSLDALAQLQRPAHVRAFSRRIAWACAALVDGDIPGWVTGSELSRLRSRLDNLPADAGSWAARLRSRAIHTWVLRGGSGQLRSLLANKNVARTGISATNLIGEAQMTADQAEIWVADSAAIRVLRADFGLLPSESGNVTIRVADVPELRGLGTGDGNAFRLIVAADLINGRDARARYAGGELLAATLAERRWRTR